jgi:hypothetical protein
MLALTLLNQLQLATVHDASSLLYKCLVAGKFKKAGMLTNGNSSVMLERFYISHEQPLYR